MYRSVAALSSAGIGAIVDDVIHDRRVLRVAVEELRETPVMLVGLHVPLDVAVERERARGDRGPGGAALFFDRVHEHSSYDLDLDTAKLSVEECAATIAKTLDDHPRNAMRNLAESLQL